VDILLDYPVQLSCFCVSDPTRIRQIVLNLVENAFKFTAKGFVRIAASTDSPGWVKIEIIDTGKGIDPSESENLFQPYSQANASIQRTNGGTGLGLCICRELVECMGGEIGFQASDFSGSCFWIRLPILIE
jgi:signal transduction histidine kinase